MAKIHLTEKYPRLGREPWAYEIHSWFPQCVWFKRYVFFRQVFDCDGMPMTGFHKFPCAWMADGVSKSATLWGHGAPTERNFKGLNVMTDLRTIEMIVEGCCPPELLMEFLGTEGIPD
ncbi:hypothetical protein ES702_02171 [subsurface metagenome]